MTNKDLKQPLPPWLREVDGAQDKAANELSGYYMRIPDPSEYAQDGPFSKKSFDEYGKRREREFYGRG